MPKMPTKTEIILAAEKLQQGGLVAFPTETVYGLGADARNGAALAAIYAAKGRPAFNPLIVHVASLAAAEELGIFNIAARHLATHFWPGALTLVVPRRVPCPISELASAGLATIALRVPNHPLAQQLLKQSDCPIAAPSANYSGHLSPTSAAHVRASLHASLPNIMVLDGGETEIGLESTIIGCLEMEEEARVILLRKGGVTRQKIELATGLPLSDLVDEGGGGDEGGSEGGSEAQLAPGRLTRHYAPKAKLRLQVTEPRANEALLAFGANAPPHAGQTINLSPSGDLTEAAANLFAALHHLDETATHIAVMPIPNTGLGEAINDRLTRAAKGR